MKNRLLHVGLALTGAALIAAGLRNSALKQARETGGTPGAAEARRDDPVNRAQLDALLRESGFPQHSYSLNGGLPSEAFCMEKLPEGWHVYYSERGGKSTLGKFRTEKEAVACFLEHVGPYLNRRAR